MTQARIGKLTILRDVISLKSINVNQNKKTALRLQQLPDFNPVTTTKRIQKPILCKNTPFSISSAPKPWTLWAYPEHLARLPGSVRVRWKTEQILLGDNPDTRKDWKTAGQLGSMVHLRMQIRPASAGMGTLNLCGCLFGHHLLRDWMLPRVAQHPEMMRCLDSHVRVIGKLSVTKTALAASRLSFRSSLLVSATHSWTSLSVFERSHKAQQGNWSQWNLKP